MIINAIITAGVVIVVIYLMVILVGSFEGAVLTLVT